MTEFDAERREIAGLFIARHGRGTERYLAREAKIRGRHFGASDERIWKSILATVRQIRNSQPKGELRT